MLSIHYRDEPKYNTYPLENHTYQPVDFFLWKAKVNPNFAPEKRPTN